MKTALKNRWKYEYWFEIFPGDMSITGVKNKEAYFDSMFDPKSQVALVKSLSREDLFKMDRTKITNVKYDVALEVVTQCLNGYDEVEHNEWRLVITFEYPMSEEDLKTIAAQTEREKARKLKDKIAANKRLLKMATKAFDDIPLIAKKSFKDIRTHAQNHPATSVGLIDEVKKLLSELESTKESLDNPLKDKVD